MGRVILHIGTLKTGTTSFQRWFSDNESAIGDATGFRWFRGDFPDAREIAAACIDENRETPAMALGFFPARGTDEWSAWVRNVTTAVRDRVTASDAPLVVIAAVNSVVSVWYYLRLAGVPILSPSGAAAEGVVRSPSAWPRVAAVVFGVGVLALPLVMNRLLAQAEGAAKGVVVQAAQADGAATR